MKKIIFVLMCFLSFGCQIDGATSVDGGELVTQELREISNMQPVPVDFQAEYSTYVWSDNPLIYIPNFGLSFDLATDSYVDVTSADLDGLTDYTVEFWFDPATTGTFDNSASPIFQNLDSMGSTSGLLFQWDVGNQHFRFSTRPYSAQYITFAASSLNADSNYVVCQSTSSGIRLFLNGVLIDDISLTGYTASSVRPFRIGANTVAGQNYIGTLDNFAVYDRELTTDEILQHYAAGADLLNR